MISTLKHKLHEDTALDGADNSTASKSRPLATDVRHQKAVHSQLDGRQSSKRESSGSKDRTTDRLKFKPK